jgi:putative ABC transport system permease protein
MDFLRTTDLGFDRERLLTIPVDDRSVQARMEPMKEAIARRPGVRRVAMSSEALPSHMNNSWTVRAADSSGAAAEHTMHIVSVDYDFFEMLGMRFAEGRNFSEAFPTDAAGFILNEAAVREIGWDAAAGRALVVGDREGRVVGVVENYHFASLHEVIRPVVYLILPGTNRASPDNFIVRVAERDLPATIAGLEAVWARFSSEQPFQVAFVDQTFAALYRNEERIARLFDAFSLLAVVIACLGLLGLASYMADRRTKELGVRKVLGASGLHLGFLLSREFLLWVTVAFVAATPVAYVVVRRWLDDFAYRIDLSAWTFLGVGLAVLLTALATVSYHALKAARTHPAKSLRYE